QFEPRPGFFLDWIDSLKDHDPTTRHVLVLDEINRCDTASVLGELLQLLEYRGRDVRLLSGRMFRFPRNVYIVGTMNSADRSIGRMDLALRRRFLWVDLTPNYEVLQTWLSRTGNNRSRFSADALRQCNALLSDRGIPPQQQVGHALFMVQTFGSETKEPADKPLLPETLRRIVKFSVVPYVAELCLMQFGRPDSELVRQVETTLLKCLTPSIDDQNGLDDDG
ncbi:MAG: AAA family ATPase, partial [Planctomycetales bacterium]